MWARLHSLLSPHFTTQLRVQPSRAVRGLTRRSSDRKRAPATPRMEERHDYRGTNAVWAWGSPPWVERAPRKFGWWGAKQVEAMNTPLTISALSFPQFTHILSRIFFTLTMNPIHEHWDDRRRHWTCHAPGWKTGLANSMCPKCPGHSDMDSPQV
jgi:hypothetical protein